MQKKNKNKKEWQEGYLRAEHIIQHRGFWKLLALECCLVTKSCPALL